MSNRLPVTAFLEAGRLRLEASSGGLATGLRGFRDGCDATWIGWPGKLPELSAADALALEARFAEHGATPIFLTCDEIDGYYEGISNGVIWPLFHYLLDQIPTHVQGWDAFCSVNEKFARAAAAEYREGDIVWVHDYQLMLVPAMLRRLLPYARIGFFLHIPFPSSEVFSICPWRQELLEGLLGADLIGFHTPAYVRHFTTSLRRILGIETNMGTTRRDGRDIRTAVFPMGVDAPAWAARAEEDDVLQRAAKIRVEAAGRKLIVGIDRLDYTKGLRHRLLAVEKLLRQDPAVAETLRLIQVTVPSRENIEAYSSLREEVDGLVGRINSTYGTSSSVPIHHIHHALDQQEVAALYRAADVMLVTPLRDGMNLVSKEFVASRPDLDGVLVLSEFAGAASELGDAVRVNPYDVDAIAAAIDQALAMDAAERTARMQSLRSSVFGQDVQRWAHSFIDALHQVQHSPGPIERFSDVASLLDRLRSAGQIELILDYDGTLVPFAGTPDGAAPDGQLLRLLHDLGSRHDTQVHVVTGRSRESIGRWLASLPLRISAEHGLWARPASSEEWQLTRPVPVEWKERLRPIVRHFVDATPGSFLEEKTASIVWHYRLADDEFGERQARELRLLLRELLSNVPVETMSGHKAVEIKAQGVSKRDAVQMSMAASANVIVVAIGDDQTDEECFPLLPEGSVTVHVNGGSTNAGYRVSDQADVRRILREIAYRPDHKSAPVGAGADCA